MLLEMMDSWARTREVEGMLIAYISPDDPKFDDYVRICPLPEECYLIQGPRRYITHSYNAIVAENPGFTHYSPLNDDHYCITPGWDKKLINLLDRFSRGWGCAMAEDNLTNWNTHPHPSGCVISKKTIKALGYMFYPKLRHIGNDVIVGRLFGNLGILHGTKDVVIEHRHWVNGKRLFDENYKWVYGQEEQSYGEMVVTHYLHHQYEIDKAKLEKAMAEE